MRTRDAVLPDAEQIHALISAYSGDGTLLPRTLAEICENVRDFIVLEDDRRIIGCGALHLTACIWPRFVRLRSILRAKATVAEDAWSRRFWRKRKGTTSPASACSRAFQNFSHVWDSLTLIIRIFPTRFIKTVTSVPGSIAAMKSR